MVCTELSEAKQMPNTQFLYPVRVMIIMFLIALFKQVNQHIVSNLTQTVKVPIFSRYHNVVCQRIQFSMYLYALIHL